MDQLSSTPNPRRWRCRQSGEGLAIGVGIGVALGAAFNNLAVGIAVGAGIGVIIDGMIARRNRSK